MACELANQQLVRLRDFLLKNWFLLQLEFWFDSKTNFQPLHNLKMVGNIFLLMTIKVVNIEHALCYLLLQVNVYPGERMADLAFSKKQRQ